ncbi:MAG: guanine deaminase [Pseudomonadota bacterium]
MDRGTVIKGRVVCFEASPFDMAPEDAVRVQDAVRVEGGVITGVGAAEALQRAGDQTTDMGEALIGPGFVDAHVHHPQTGIIASWGKRLRDWLESYTFPEEARFDDAGYAAEVAARYLDLALAQGTTTVASFATSHPQSVTTFFEAARARGMRVVAGKTCMDRNAPEGLCDTAQRAYDESRALIEAWHGVDRLSYAITPRFAPTSTPAQLDALGALWAAHPDCLMQTHLSEQVEEIAWVRALYPGAVDYLDVYERHGLLGPRAVFGHAIHLTPRERDRLRDSGAALVHCPTSNAFIGSGLFDMGRAVADGLRVGLASDIGGGSSFSMLRTMAACYEVGQLSGTVLHPARLLWLATAGSARALHLGTHVGRIAPGMEADLVALDLASTPAIAQRAARADTLWEAVFPTIMMGDDRAIAGVWVAGKRVNTQD